MLYGNDREQIRFYYYEAWQKYLKNQSLNELESIIVEVIQQNPEFQYLFEADAYKLNQNFDNHQVNPFWQMGLHIAIKEQIKSDRPLGIRQIYHQLKQHYESAHKAENIMIHYLEQILIQSQQTGMQPDEYHYLRKLYQLIK